MKTLEELEEVEGLKVEGIHITPNDNDKFEVYAHGGRIEWSDYSGEVCWGTDVDGYEFVEISDDENLVDYNIMKKIKDVFFGLGEMEVMACWLFAIPGKVFIFRPADGDFNFSRLNGIGEGSTQAKTE